METSLRTPKETAEYIVETAVKKAKTPFLKLLILAMLAGAYVGFGAHLFSSVTTSAEAEIGYGLTKFFGGIVFSTALMLVIIAGAELFTGNTLMVVGLLQKRITLKSMLRNWILVFTFNFVGALLLALLIWKADMNGVVTNTDVVSSID